MDWLKWFTLLVAVASVQITAEGPKKKIRIHLPQKVKHIHHHKKIYITNHPASSQYAPAYLPGVKGAARPGAGLLPLGSLQLPAVAPAASKLLPLYRARGRYGPPAAAPQPDWDEEYDLAPPPDPLDGYAPASFASVPSTAASSGNLPKRIKIFKINDQSPRKKVVRKIKPKRVYFRPRTHPKPQPISDDELPVSSFHEQFYSDLEDAGTIKKIRKPPRVEKIIDGDTEHIHTYSEEHIHKVVFDNDQKVTGVVGVDPIGSMSALAAAHPLIPLKNAQTLVAIPSASLADLAVVGSMGTPSHLEYSSYNPRDVTHDHIFHDHGELPSGVEVTRETLRVPPKVSYNSHGLRLGGSSSKRQHGKFPNYYAKPTKPTPDFSYYESIYAPKYKSKKTPKPTYSTPLLDATSDSTFNNFRPIPQFRLKESKRTKSRNKVHNYNTKPLPNFNLHQASVPTPFSLSSTVVHNYDTKNFANLDTSATGHVRYKDPLRDFNFSDDFDYDAFASSSNLYASASEDNNDSAPSGKKSVSTQNINFGGQDLQTYVDHLSASASTNVETSVSEESDSAAESNLDAATVVVSPTPYTIKETSPAHPYYQAMALQALHGELPSASNDHAQYAAPPDAPLGPDDSADPTAPTLQVYSIQSSDAIPTPQDIVPDIRQGKKRKEKNNAHKAEIRQRYPTMKDFSSSGLPERPLNQYSYTKSPDSSSVKSSLKYGDKI